LDDAAARERVARVEALLEEIESLHDPDAREKALEAIQALLDLYGEGLDRLVSRVAARDDGDLARELADDELVSHLLLLHDLHPVPTPARVRAALEEVRPYLESHGGDVELIEVTGDTVRLKLDGSCQGCPSSAVTLKLAIENEIRKAAPEIEEIVAEGAAAAAPRPQLLQIELPAGGDAPRQDGGHEAWEIAGSKPELSGPARAPLSRRVAGEELLFLAVDDEVYAYRPPCPACGASLAGGAVDGAELACGECGHSFDVVHAGRSLHASDLHLDPVPLLVDNGGVVKVATATPA
jgi:Fe-S cluster biogenesis protein NfuA/nitrite reductase/ring-hydroxylating ferredoxin subunit